MLLLDEPLGALDLKLREQMQVELKAIQRRVGITFIYVTHDQGEALSMSDRVAVFNHGRIEQMASPGELYERPKTAFVAGFVGISNLIDGALAERLTGAAQSVSVRPEKIHLEPGTVPPPADVQTVTGTISSILYLGANTRYLVALEGGGELTVLLQNRDAHFEPVQGDTVRLWWEQRYLMRFAS